MPRNIETFVGELEMSKEDMDETITTVFQALADSGGLTETLLALATRYDRSEDSLRAVVAGFVVATAIHGGSN